MAESIYTFVHMVTVRPLTARQHEILRKIARGATNKEIANDLGISEQGVKAHVSRMLERYGAANRVELVGLSHAWADGDSREYGSLGDEVADLQNQLQSVEGKMATITQLRGVRERTSSGGFAARSNGLSPSASPDVLASVESLRDLLREVNIAVKLAAELPPETVSGPLIEAVRTRMHSALEQSERVAALLKRRAAAQRSDRPRGKAN